MLKILAIICTQLFILGCENSYTDRIFLPLSDSSNGYIVYIDENNLVQKESYGSDIVLKKNRLTPILCYTSDYDEKPLGCVYPFSTELDVHGGFAAWVVYKLLCCSNEEPSLVHEYLTHFNWKKFLEILRKYENPWILDQELIFENISDRTFNIYSVKELL